ncbi:MAG: hypothetical protein NC421_00235 [Lachnospiraceae bacterium]|nr:hypothetical protein [Lachnospiraceae bacterium]
MDIFDARLFVPAFSAPRLSPRGGALTALPFHGIPPINPTLARLMWDFTG